MSVFNILVAIGGLAFFMFGMNTLSSGLEKASGGLLEKVLAKMSGNIFTSIFFGAVVTAAVQSSTATTVIVIGLVNAGILKLRGAVGIIMGANIGTTMTAQILRLAKLEGSKNGNFLIDLIKPTNFSAMLAIAGIILIMFSKRNRKKNIGFILMGVAILFTGMNTMRTAVEPLAELDVFKKNYIAPGDRFIWRDGRWWQSRSSMFFPEAMQGAADRFGWDKKWVGWNKPYWVSEDGKRARGVGMGVIGNADINEDNTEAIVRIIPDLVGNPRASRAVIEMDITESGMGTRSNVVKQVAEVLNVPVDRVYITEPGSKYNPSNYGLCGSRGVITTGKAATLAAEECKKKALELAATYFKRSVDQMETKDFVVYVRDTPELKVPMFKLCPKELSIVGYGKHMELFNIPSCIAVFADVEVDLETGRQRLLHIGAGTDIGQVLDPKALEMQLEGGIGSACFDTASFEECIQDHETGRLVTSNLLDYKWRTFNEFPTYDAYVMESQIDSYMFRALGIGEVSGAAGAGAVLMAVSNATGVDIKEYPATPAVILKAIGKL